MIATIVKLKSGKPILRQVVCSNALVDSTILVKHFHAGSILLKGRHGGSTAFDRKTPRSPSKQQRKRKVKLITEKAIRENQLQQAKDKAKRANLKPPPGEIEKMLSDMENKLGSFVDALKFPNAEGTADMDMLGAGVANSKKPLMATSQAQEIYQKILSLESSKGAESDFRHNQTKEITSILANPTKDELLEATKALLLKSSFTSDGLKMISLLQSKNIPIPCEIYTLQIKAVTSLKNFQEGDRIFDHMIKSGMNPDVFAWTALVENKAYSGDTAAAKELINQVEACGIETTIEMYNAVLNSYLLNKNFEEAQKYWIKMHGIPGVLLDLESFHTILKVCKQTNQAERALFYFDELRCRKLQPTRETFNLLFYAVAEAPHWVSGYENTIFDVMSYMEGMEIAPDVRTYVAILHAFAKAGDGVAAEFYYWEMIRKGIAPTSRVYEALLFAYARSCSVHASHYGYRGRYIKPLPRIPSPRLRDEMEIGPEKTFQYMTMGLHGNEAKERGKRQVSPLEDSLDDGDNNAEDTAIRELMRAEAQEIRQKRERVKSLGLNAPELAKLIQGAPEDSVIGQKQATALNAPIMGKGIFAALQRIEKTRNVDDLDEIIARVDESFLEKPSPALSLFEKLCVELKPDDFADVEDFMSGKYAESPRDDAIDENESERTVAKGRRKPKLAINRSNKANNSKKEVDLRSIAGDLEEASDSDSDNSSSDSDSDSDSDFDSDSDSDEEVVRRPTSSSEGDDEYSNLYEQGHKNYRGQKWTKASYLEYKKKTYPILLKTPDHLLNERDLFKKRQVEKYGLEYDCLEDLNEGKPKIDPRLRKALGNMTKAETFKDEFQGVIPISNPVGLGAEVNRDQERFQDELVMKLLDGEKLTEKDIAPVHSTSDIEDLDAKAKQQWDLIEFGRAPEPDYRRRLSIRRRLFIRRAELAWMEMQKHGIKPTTALLNFYISVYAESKQEFRFPDLLTTHFGNHKLAMNSDTYRHVIRMYLRMPDIPKALAMKTEAQSKGITLDSYTYGLLIEVCSMRGDVVDSIKLLEEATALKIPLPEKNIRHLRGHCAALGISHPDMPVDPNLWVKQIRELQKKGTKLSQRRLQVLRSATFA